MVGITRSKVILLFVYRQALGFLLFVYRQALGFHLFATIVFFVAAACFELYGGIWTGNINVDIEIS